MGNFHVLAPSTMLETLRDQQYFLYNGAKGMRMDEKEEQSRRNLGEGGLPQKTIQNSGLLKNYSYDGSASFRPAALL